MTPPLRKPQFATSPQEKKFLEIGRPRDREENVHKIQGEMKREEESGQRTK